MKNAICMLIFGNELYIPGACASAWVHRRFITESMLLIKLVVMVDNHIFKYKKELEKYFDEVILIDMLEVKLNPEYYIIEKYSKWMKYSINKWQIFNLTDYDKVLFVDIDILPIKSSFYKVFDNNTPGFLIKGFELNNKLINKKNVLKFNQSDDFNFDTCYKFSSKLFRSIDAGFVLIKPDSDLFQEYFDFIVKCASDKGYISMKDSGVDETSLLIYFMFYKRIPIYSISYEYAVIPWESHRYNKYNVKGINFLAMVKPWTVLPMMQWAEQNIWHKIAKKAFEKDSRVTEIYVSNLILTLENLIDNYDVLINKKNSPYNFEGIKKHTLLFDKIKEIIKDNMNNELDYDDKKEIMDLSKDIHKYMDKKPMIEMKELEEIID